MANRILTEQEAYNIGKQGTPTTNLLCTYTRAQALGCTVASGYTLAANQLVYEGSLERNYTNGCVYTITSGPYGDQADCEYGNTSTSFRYNVSGYVTASNQSGYVSGNVGGWSQNDRWTGTESAEYTHPGCPNSTTITWNVYQEDCDDGSSSDPTSYCTYTITDGPYDGQARCSGSASTSITYTVSGDGIYESNQSATVYADVGRWSHSYRNSVTASTEYTHSGCSNSITITWEAYQEDCANTSECIYTIHSGYEYARDIPADCSGESTYSFIYDVDGAVVAYDQSITATGYAGSWSHDYGTESQVVAHFNHPGCPNNGFIKWYTYQSGCGS